MGNIWNQLDIQWIIGGDGGCCISSTQYYGIQGIIYNMHASFQIASNRDSRFLFDYDHIDKHKKFSIKKIGNIFFSTNFESQR